MPLVSCIKFLRILFGYLLVNCCFGGPSSGSTTGHREKNVHVSVGGGGGGMCKMWTLCYMQGEWKVKKHGTKIVDFVQ